VTGTARTNSRRHVPHVSLNSDGNPHPVENALTVFTLVAGLASFVVGLILRNTPSAGAATAIVATAAGLAALLVGLYAQMVSATREQRVLIVAGIIAGFVGLAIGLSKGGFVA
jgi:FtsH-binding integral membrane protein